MWKLCSELCSTNNSSTLGAYIFESDKIREGKKKSCISCFLGERIQTEMISRMFKGCGGTPLVCKTLLHVNGWQCE